MISRRGLFKLVLASPLMNLVKTNKIPKDIIWQSYNKQREFWENYANMQINNPRLNVTLYGIPYHETNDSSGQ